MNDKAIPPFWNVDWLQAQQKYLEAWGSLAKTQGSTPPWNEMLDLWRYNVPSSAPEGSAELYAKMMEQGKAFYFMGEQFTKLLQGMTDLNKASEDWPKLLNDQFEKIKSTFTEFQGDAQKNMHGMMGAWQLLPLDTLQRTFSSASIMPGDFFEDLKPEALQTVTDKFLSVPGVGYTRESQEQMQKGFKLWNDYYKVSQEYNNAMSKVGLDALEVMRLRFLEMAECGEEIKSLRQIYDLWVDCNEKTCAEYVHTDEYSELYGRMTNALMAVKQHSRNTIDETLNALNMPTRRGMNTIQKRQQELRREHTTAMHKIKQHEKELQELRQLVSDYKLQGTSTTANVSPDDQTKTVKNKTSYKKVTKKAVRKKKVSKKK